MRQRQQEPWISKMLMLNCAQVNDSLQINPLQINPLQIVGMALADFLLSVCQNQHKTPLGKHVSDECNGVSQNGRSNPSVRTITLTKQKKSC